MSPMVGPQSAGDGSAAMTRKKVNLALQGGGAHGAFTWGVLDGLIEDGRVDIEGLSGTSAGAVNAVMVADGMARDPRYKKISFTGSAGASMSGKIN